MIIELKIPSPGESITEVELASWLVENGDIVEKDQEIAEVESDKATLPLVAEEGGKISLKAGAGDTLKVGDIACTIDTDFAGKGETKKKDKPQPTGQVEKPDKKEVPVQKEEKNAAPTEQKAQKGSTETDNVKVSPLAQKIMEENHLSVNDIIQGLRRITRQDVEIVLQEGSGEHPSVLAGAKTASASREVQKNRISSLRRKLAQRLVAVKNETAMLTTFNEVDMSAVMNLRKKYQQAFVEKHGIKLGFMSFFTKAVTEALKLHPNVNSMIDGEDLITPSYMDIGIAVQTDKGLMVPVIRNTESLGLAEIEKHIMELATKARKNRISIEEMTGGTFTITNGGIFGSMMSTPVLNPPQSGILGMHNIVERPVAIDGKVEIRPMMYIALSYDHRVIDGKDSVGFLMKIKQFIEAPHTLLFGGHEPDKLLLDL